MISLPTSGFNFGARRALFISTQQVAVYQWEDNDCGHSSVFDAGEEGRQNFRRYLAETADIPCLTRGKGAPKLPASLAETADIPFWWTCLMKSIVRTLFRMYPGAIRQALLKRKAGTSRSFTRPAPVRSY